VDTLKREDSGTIRTPDDSSFITGAQLFVDGGAILRNRVFQPTLVVEDYAQVAVGFPEIRPQAEGVAIGDGGAAQI